MTSGSGPGVRCIKKKTVAVECVGSVSVTDNTITPIPDTQNEHTGPMVTQSCKYNNGINKLS